jgi:hypothetical protein
MSLRVTESAHNGCLFAACLQALGNSKPHFDKIRVGYRSLCAIFVPKTIHLIPNNNEKNTRHRPAVPMHPMEQGRPIGLHKQRRSNCSR